MRSKILLCILLSIAVFACKRDSIEELGSGIRTTPFDLHAPHYFPLLEVPADNPLTVEGIQL
ncbi:MAG TPA: hypothetical protein PK735_01660, partial [Flavobacteriales bacterium]|nr:hypothetical protein [Flavobacteriales bacterium]